MFLGQSAGAAAAAAAKYEGRLQILINGGDLNVGVQHIADEHGQSPPGASASGSSGNRIPVRRVRVLAENHRQKNNPDNSPDSPPLAPPSRQKRKRRISDFSSGDETPPAAQMARRTRFGGRNTVNYREILNSDDEEEGHGGEEEDDDDDEDDEVSRIPTVSSRGRMRKPVRRF